MTSKIIIRLFLGLVFLQLLVPYSMIAKREIVLRQGVAYKFKVAPVDPYDAFRGRYVALRTQENVVPVAPQMKVSYGQAVYALISVDEQGFARLTGISLQRPGGQSYLRAKVSSSRYENKVHLNLLLDRYYMEESAAPRAQELYRKHTAKADRKDSYILVRVKDGFAVIENLYVGGEKIEDAVKNPALLK